MERHGSANEHDIRGPGARQPGRRKKKSDLGVPGGLLLLPRAVTSILVADMHGQIDNLLS
ncbi:MAG TPA: hypothetical protein PK440_09150 [Candidatus Accumulibacter phosphatis]|nr:hypothetical protein [Accumulibacter sp.]HCN66716.1 hypothetical protein [Accumulibacter sp.]HRL74744.1 hypothetical protein [Candidatus Accumulibacter phosphatis]HRQ95151.1 hypothetical protein [Candidatus Accumulibacter phosphatis]